MQKLLPKALYRSIFLKKKKEDFISCLTTSQ